MPDSLPAPLARPIFGRGDRLWLIRNPRAGARGDARPVVEALAASGARVEVFSTRRAGEVPALAAQALTARPAAVIAYGGDGTLNAVAARLRGSPIPLGVVPGGTFNYFARSLGVPHEPVAAALALLHARPMLRDVGEANDRLFLNNASFGLYRRVIEQRERHKSWFGRTRAVAWLSGVVTALQPHPLYDVDIVADGRHRHLRSPMLFFGANVLQLEGLSARLAHCVTGGELAVLALKPMSRLDMVRIGAFALAGAIDDSDRVESFCAEEVVIARRAYTIRVVLDGEVRKLLLPLRVRRARAALRVLVPAAPE